MVWKRRTWGAEETVGDGDGLGGDKGRVTVEVTLQLGRGLCVTYAGARVSFGLCLSTT